MNVRCEFSGPCNMVLSPLEAKLLDALEIVRDYLTRGTINRKDYLHLMTTVRDAIKLAENRKLGCPSGLHSSYCTCKEDKPGMSRHYLTYRKNK